MLSIHFKIWDHAVLMIHVAGSDRCISVNHETVIMNNHHCCHGIHNLSGYLNTKCREDVCEKVNVRVCAMAKQAGT